jgi:hypothetical protein
MTAMRPARRLLPLVLMLIVAACAPTASPPGPAGLATGAAHDGFLANLRQHCGRAYGGRLAVAPPGDEMLRGDEPLVVHFRECGTEQVKLPFHIEKEPGRWDRSRTWVFMRTSAGIELRHDHRREDGVPDEQTWYGGHTQSWGTAQRQEFVYAERRAADGSVLGWRVEIVPGERYTYGTIRGGNWTWRVDFDLTQPVATPPAPWGHGATPAAAVP